MAGRKFLVENGTVKIQGERIAEYINFINEHNYKSVEIMSHRYKLADIHFLKECPQIEELFINSPYITDFSGLYKLKNLRTISLVEIADIHFLNECPQIEELSISSPYITDFSVLYKLENLTFLGLTEPEIKIDFTKLNSFSRLESLSMDWNKNVKGFEQCCNLKELSLWKYKPKTKSLEELALLTNLEKLDITKGNINSLKGCGAFPKLTKLETHYLRNLEYIDEIEKNSFLTYLEFENCSKIKNHSIIASLKELETLILSNCGDIQSLRFVKEIPKLKHLSFEGSNIVDGDITPCIGIDFVGFNNKRHYSHKFEELNPELAERLSRFK